MTLPVQFYLGHKTILLALMFELQKNNQVKNSTFTPDIASALKKLSQTN